MRTIFNSIPFLNKILSNFNEQFWENKKNIEFQIAEQDFNIFTSVSIQAFPNGVLNLELFGVGDRVKYKKLVNKFVEIYGEDNNGNLIVNDDASIEEGDYDYTWYFKNEKHELAFEDEELFYGINLSCFDDKCILVILNLHNLVNKK